MGHPVRGLLRATLLALALAAWSTAAWAADPTGTWRFDQAALDTVADQIAGAMAAEFTAERRRELLAQAREREAEFAKLEKEDPQAAARMLPELRRARGMAGLAAQPKTVFKRQFLASLGDPDQTSLEFQPEGTLVYNSVSGGRPQRGEGAWASRNEEVELVVSLPAPDGSLTYLHLRGPLHDQRLELRHAGSDEDAAKLAQSPALAKAMREATWVLVRQR